MDKLSIMAYFRIRASKVLLQKCVPLSLIMARGVPKREKMFSSKNLTTTLLSFVLCNTLFPEYVLNCVFSFSIVFFDLLSVFDRFQFQILFSNILDFL